MARKTDKPASHSPRFVNRRARHNFHILEVVECGISLEGTEVKSLRAGSAVLQDTYVRVNEGEAFLIGLNIAPYAQASPLMQHEPSRRRKLLVRKRQIAKMEAHARPKGNTLVPLAIYFKRGWAKCEVGLAVGKRQYDKRQAIKQRQQQRDIAREIGRRGRR